MFETLDDVELVDTIVAEVRVSAVSHARRYAAIAELERRRNTGEHAHWVCDDGIVPAPLLAELIGRGAKLPVVAPKPEPQPRYRPSIALDEFVRTRDMTCRAVGCDRRAIYADIDHTVPYPADATHPGNSSATAEFTI